VESNLVVPSQGNGQSHVTDFTLLCEAVFEALPCEIIAHDNETIIAANAAVCRLFETTSPRGLVGLPVSSLTHPDAKAAGAERRRLLFAHSQSYPCVGLKLMSFKGNTIKIDAMARRFDLGQMSYALVIGLGATGGCAVDGDDWQHDMPEFPAETPFSVAILDAMPQPITVFDGSDRIVYANDAAARILRAGRREGLIGRTPSALLHPLVQDAAAERRRMVLEQGQVFTGIKSKAVALDGFAFDTLSSLGRAITRDGDAIGYWMAHSIVPTSESALA